MDSATKSAGVEFASAPRFCSGPATMLRNDRSTSNGVAPESAVAQSETIEGVHLAHLPNTPRDHDHR